MDINREATEIHHEHTWLQHPKRGGEAVEVGRYRRVADAEEAGDGGNCGSAVVDGWLRVGEGVGECGRSRGRARTSENVESSAKTVVNCRRYSKECAVTCHTRSSEPRGAKLTSNEDLTKQIDRRSNTTRCQATKQYLRHWTWKEFTCRKTDVNSYREDAEITIGAFGASGFHPLIANPVDVI